MGPDPRGSPSDEDYIHHLEFFNEQRQRRIEELERERAMIFFGKTAKRGKLLALIGLWFNLYLWIPLMIIRWSERGDRKPYEL